MCPRGNALIRPRTTGRPTMRQEPRRPTRSPGAMSFRFLSWDSEDTEVARWLRARGVAAFVLKYRTKETAASREAFGREMAGFFGTSIRFNDRGSPEGSKALAEDLRKAGALGIADGR